MVNKDVIPLALVLVCKTIRENTIAETFLYKKSKNICNSAAFETLCTALSDRSTQNRDSRPDLHCSAILERSPQIACLEEPGNVVF